MIIFNYICAYARGYTLVIIIINNFHKNYHSICFARKPSVKNNFPHFPMFNSTHTPKKKKKKKKEKKKVNGKLSLVNGKP